MKASSNNCRAYLRLVAQLLIEQLQLGLNGVKVSKRVRAAAINHMYQHPSTLAMPQELMPQAPSLVSPLQQPCQAVV